MNTAWLMLTVAGLLEVGWSIGLKYTDGFNFRGRPLACSLTLAAMVASMYLLALAVRSIPIGTGYAIWTGIGAIGAAVLGMVLFREPATAARIGCVLLIVAGIIGLKLTSSASAAAAVPTTAPGADVISFYIGSKEGVSRATLNVANGKLSDVVMIAPSKGATFIALHPTLPVLYAVAETSKGSVRAFRIGDGGAMTLVNEVSCAGDGPCHVSVSADGSKAFVANYGSGSVTVLPIGGDGSLGESIFADQHTGKSVNEARQTGPRAHCMVPDPSGRFVLSADLGTDEVIVYRIDGAKVSRVSATKATPGVGPRIIVFSRDAKFVYVVTELMNTVETYRWDAASGGLTHIDLTSTLPKDFAGESFCAEIAVHPNGRFLYASYRGRDSIAVFKIDPATGMPTLTGDVPTGGRGPRHFAIDPAGRFMIVANTKSDEIAAFSVDSDTGRLTPTGSLAKVISPACIAFIRD